MSENSTPPAAPSAAEAAATAQWKSRPVFISSTFRDMQWERDYLNRYTFPRLAEELAKRHHHLEPIDLRLGVEAGQAGSEEARELLVLKVCLDEIKRSRPFLLVLLGDRYGWVPPPERIETAAREQGMKKPEAGKSVTALEIEFGILRDPENPNQKSRSLFFFRQPLPYADMPDAVRADYSDAHSPDPQVRAGHAKLSDLKAALQRDPELAGRLHDYSVGWDPERNKVTDLEAFGNLVFEKLWAVIDAETKDWAAKPAPTWEEQERAGLAEFIEHRSRGFTGRKDLLEKLHAIATSPTDHSSPTSSTAHFYSACLTGTPGSGKSAVFAQLHRDLEKDPSLLILANAAGGTQRGSSVDSMLRRWIGEMNAFLEPVEPPKPGVIVPNEPEPQIADSGPKPNAISFRRKPKQLAGPVPKLRADLLPQTAHIPANASNDDVEAAFYSLLHRVSSQRRVVVLLDALDQFEPTPRGRHLTWFKPQQWPANARLIATAIPGTASSVLAQAPGTAEFDLPPLTAADAQAIGTHVWGRYHRTLNPAVLAVLIEKPLPDGSPACGNPLWLTLALEQLNLLDADDFARAEREFTGSPGERLAALLLDTARRMPPDIESLYGWLLEQNEKAFGLAETRAFTTAIALSRSGWRESDLLDLVPRLAQVLDPKFKIQNSKFDILALASTRRSFRAHLVRRGENEQLDFFHAQMRRAGLARCVPDEPQRRAIHAAISDFLESLPDADPLIRLERMAQLIGERNALRAARYYATLELDTSQSASTERLGSDWTIVEWITAVESSSNPNPNLNWITSWFQLSDLTNEEIYRLTFNFRFGLLKLMESCATLSTRQQLHSSSHKALSDLTSTTQNGLWLRDFSASFLMQGDIQYLMGNLSDAIESYKHGLRIIETLFQHNLNNPVILRDLSVDLERIAMMLHKSGDATGAIKSYYRAKGLLETLVNSSPHDVGLQIDLAENHEALARSLKEIGNSQEALDSLLRAEEILNNLLVTEKSNRRVQAQMAGLQVGFGEFHANQGKSEESIDRYETSIALHQDLLNADPGDKECQKGLALAEMAIADINFNRGKLNEGIENLRRVLATYSQMLIGDSSDNSVREVICSVYNRIGVNLTAQNDFEGSVDVFRKAIKFSDSCVQDYSNRGLMYNISTIHGNFGSLLIRQGNWSDGVLETRKALKILEDLVAHDPINSKFKRALAATNAALGDALESQGKLMEAMAEFKNSLDSFSSLSNEDPKNTGLQHDIALALSRIGQVHFDCGNFTEAANSFGEARSYLLRLTTLDKANARWQREHAVTHYKIARALHHLGNFSNERYHRHECYRVLDFMKNNNQALETQMEEIYEQLQRECASPPRVSQTPPVTPKTMTPEELRTSAEANFRQQRWDAAETYYTRLLDLGEPLAEVVPRLVACLLNAHDELSPTTRTRIEDLLTRLEAAGHAALALEVRATYTARLPKKPWWKLWK